MRSRRRTLAVALLLASVAFVAPSRARAQASEPPVSGVDVAWTAPDECPSGAELQRRVATRAPADAAVRARGRVEKRAGRYRLSLEIATTSSRGERAIDAATCDALASSAAVVIAMSVAPVSEPAPGEPAAAAPVAANASPPSPPNAPSPADAPSPVASSPPVASPSPDRANASTPARGEPPPSRVLIRAALVGDAGLLPAAAVGGGLAVGVSLVRALTVEASVDLFGSQDGTLEASAAGTGAVRGAAFTLLTAGARACLALTRGIEVAPCLGFEVARIGASGFGAARVSDADSSTWGPEALLAGRIPVAGPVSVRVGLGAFVPMSRQSFVINGAGTIHQPGVVALRTFAGPEVRF